MVATAEKSKPRKTRTREQSFKKKKTKEASQRAASLAASGTTAATARSSSARAKGKGKAGKLPDKPTFRYVSFNDRLAAAHIDVARSQRSSAISGLDPLPGLSGTGASGSSNSTSQDTSTTLALFSSEDAALANIDLSELSSTAFGTALVTWRELNQSLPFYAFVRRILPLSNSLPQLIHHAETIADALSELLGASAKAAATPAPTIDPSLEKKSTEQAASYLAFAPALDLIPRLAYDLQAEFLPYYPRSLEALLRTTQVTKADTDGVDFLAADIVESAFKATAGLLRIVAPFVLADGGGKGMAKKEQLQETWRTLRPYLGWVEPRSRATPESFEDWDGMDVDDEGDDDEDDEEAEGDQDQESGAEEEEVEEEAEDDEQDDEEEDLDGDDQADPDDTLSAPTARKQQYRRRRVPPHTRRFASEAFAHLVRKAKGTRLSHVARFMLADVATMRGWAEEGRISKEDGKGFESAVAGVWAEVIKSVDDHLHSSATQFIDATLLAEAGIGQDLDGNAVPNWAQTFAEARLSTGVLLLTALIHHSSATQMLEVIKHLLGWVTQRLQKPEPSNVLREAVIWLTTVVGVRKGNRVHETLKGPLFALLIQLSNHVAGMTATWDAVTEEGLLCRAILSLITLLFPSGRIQDLIGPGLKVMDALTPSSATASGDAKMYARQSFVFNALVLSLADPTLAWSGFRQFVMPAVLKHTADVAASFNRTSQVNTSPDASTHALDVCFALLARLNELGELGPAVTPAAPTPAIGKWRIQIGNALTRRMKSLANGDISQIIGELPTAASARAQFLAELSLLPIFAKDLGVELSTSLCDVIRVLVDDGCKDDEIALDSYRQHPINVVLVLSASLSALASVTTTANSEIGAEGADLKKSISRPAFDLFFEESSTVALNVLQRCGFHIATMCALREALTAATVWWQRRLSTADDIAALPTITDALCSIEDRSRLAACELLSLLSSLGTNKDEAAYYDRLLEIERTALTIETIRERNARVRAAARSIVQSVKLLPKGSSAPAHIRRAQSFTIRYIVGSLKLNFRPVWSESIAALVDLAAVYGDEVWQVAFGQLDVVQDPVHIILKSANWISTASKEAEEDDFSDVLERNFKDPILDRRNKAFKLVFDAAAGTAAGSSALFPKDAAGDQRPRGRLDPVNYHDQILKFYGEIPRLAEKHNAPLVQRFFSIVQFDIEEEPKDETEDTEIERSESPRRTFLERRAQLCAYLELFGKFGNPKALLRTDDLHSYFLELCASGDLKVQQLALTCILTWKDASQTQYADSLKNLLDPSAFRDELMQFDLAPDGNIIQVHHRPSLMPLLVRLLYGQIISRRGKATAGPGKNSRKHAILSALASCEPVDLDVLIQLMLRSLEDQLPVFEAESGQFKFSTQPSSASRKRQVGFLALLSDVLKHLGQLVLPHWPSLLGVTLNLGHHAVRTHDVQSQETFSKGGRSVRRAVYQRLADFSKRSIEFDWIPFLIPMFDSMINAQAQLLRLEAMQGPTALLELLHTWSSRTDTMMFLGSVNEDIPRHLLACLSAPAAASSVVSKVLEIFERIIMTSVDEQTPKEDRQSKREMLIEPYLGDVLAHGGALLERLQKPKNANAPFAGRDEILKRTVAMLAALAPYVQRPSDAELLLKLLIPMLRQQRTLDERVKKDLLSIFSDLCLKAPSFHDTDSEFYESLMQIMSSMFAVLRNRQTRTALVAAFRNFGVVQPSLKQVTIWVEELNAYSTKRLEEPDFDRRLNAFFQINELDATTATTEVWLPLLHNMIFFVQDAEELAFRTNAAAALRQFFGLAATRTEEEDWQRLLLRVALPAVRKVMRSKADLVRREALSLLASAIEMLPTVPALSQMKGLLTDGDGEANFFNNIVHLQVHRRVRAMRRLGDEVEKGVMSGKLIKETFIPLISIFLDPVQTSDQQLINEAISCVGRLAGALTWYGYQALVWSLIRSAREHPLNEKVVVRTLMTVLDNFRFDLKAVAAEEGPQATVANIATADDDGSDVDEAEAEAEARLAQNAKISEAVTTRLLPALMGFLEAREDTDDAIRLPIAVGVARLALKLPTNESRARINKLLHTLTGALKSKSQDTRDLTREVFLKIARILGPQWLFSISIELKKGLTRGPQIAVAAFTFHAVLVHLMDSPENPLVTVDAEMPTIMSIVSEDLFGLTSEDRNNAEYKSKHREVRQSKSLDTLERLAKISAPHRVATILLPLREVMERTEAQRPLRVVDDALRRISSGLIANTHIDAHTFLVLCHSLISGNARFLQTKTKASAAGGKLSAKGIDNTSVLQKRKAIESQRSDSNHYGRNAFRFVAFGLDLLLTALKRGRLSFAGVDDQQQQLLPLVKSVGNSLYSSQASIVQLALKATAELVKTPLTKVTESLPAFIKQIFSIIQAAGSAQSDTVQAAFRTLTTIIRERKDAVFQEKQLADLLRLMMPDLEEPSVQWIIFGLLRAIIARRFVIAEVYDVMTKIAEMMVTNQSASARENCRALMLQFLLEYPQGKGRLKSQMSFLAKNLSFTFESGRLSVLELLRAIFSKFDDAALQPFHELILVALVMVMANDDSESCRNSAGELIRTIVGQQTSEARSKTITMVHSWAVQPDRPTLSCVALQLYGILLDGSADATSEWLDKAMEIAMGIVRDCADDLVALQSDDSMQGVVLDFKLPLSALQAASRLFKGKPGLLNLNDEQTWAAVENLLVFPQESVRLTSSRLLGAMYSQSDAADSEETAIASAILSPSHLIETGKKVAKQLTLPPLSDDLSLQAVKNLLYIGRHLPTVSTAPSSSNIEPKDDGDVDDDGGSDSEADADDAADDEDEVMSNPLAWLFSKLSFQARNAVFASEQRYDDRRWHAQPSAILRWFAAMTSTLDADIVKGFLPHMLTPIFYITDDSTIRGNEIEELKGLAMEVQTLIQEKVGANTFSQAYSRIRQRALTKRRERKTAKLMTTISRPAAAAQRKSKVNARKHDSRKRKAQYQADSKIRNRPLKRHRTAE